MCSSSPWWRSTSTTFRGPLSRQLGDNAVLLWLADRSERRLRLLEIAGYTRSGGTDFATRDEMVTIWERWRIAWSPDFDAKCIEAARYGASLADAISALAAFRPLSGRLRTIELPGGGAVIDDTYNANPDSVRAAIAVLARAPSPRWLVLGDMGEVGDQGVAFHREVGAYARAAGVDRLLGVGELAQHAVAAFGAGGEHFDSVGTLAEALHAGPGVTVLVKGSRFMRMERVVAALTGATAAVH